MGTPKAELTVHGVRLLDRAVTALRDGGCAPVLAVVRPGVDVAGAIRIVNDDPERGMRSSLALAADAAVGDALAVLLVDMPAVDGGAVLAVVAAWQAGRIAVASYDGQRGHPIVMAPRFWQDALALAGPDEGARAYLAGHPDLVDEVEVAGNPADLDTPDDLARWRRS
ncbi:MAG: hypothetical protein JWO57_1002 [Pseudonocardiales bacterium]|nr:hypothetical protein [Pseudonocardiales bacterium]